MYINKNTEMGDVLPELHPLIDLLNTKFHKPLAAVTLGKVSLLHQGIPYENTDEEQPTKVCFNIIKFYDPRFPRMPKVGYVKYRPGDNTFEVYSPNIANEKYRRGSTEYRTRRTKDVKKAFKFIETFICPHTPQEVMHKNIDEVNRVIRLWRMEYRDKIQTDFYGHKDVELYTEIGHLKNLGATFTTPYFRELSEVRYPLYVEHARRSNIRFARYHIYKLNDGRVFLSRKDEGSENLSDMFWAETSDQIVSEIYPSIDALPENILSKYALLNMLGGEDPKDGKGSVKPSAIPEVGVRIASDEFFIIEPLDNATNV